MLGLDGLYRKAMKRHEAGELLGCARQVARSLKVKPLDVPVEGYYAESEKLRTYFRLMRTLQNLDDAVLPAVQNLSSFGRLSEVVSSPIFGRAASMNKLLPAGYDPLSQALDEISNWALESLVTRSSEIAHNTDDYSLVGLAARTNDAVVLAAIRESVVFYAGVRFLSMPKKIRYVWRVSKDLVEAAGRFIETFNGLFDDELPAPRRRNAAVFWDAYKDNKIFGRCVHIGSNVRCPADHYHWAVSLDQKLAVHAFWHREIWTTERYILALVESRGRPRI